MRDHRADMDPKAQQFDMSVITRALASMGTVSRQRMMAIRDITKPLRRKRGRTTVGKNHGGKAGKILRGQR